MPTIGSRPRAVRLAGRAANRCRPPSSDRWPAAAPWTAAFALASALGLVACGESRVTGDDGRVYFAESSRAYEIRSLDAHLDQFDERVSLGSIADMIVTPKGYFVADGLNQRVVLLDRSLNPVRIAGRDGDGPGEYRFPRRMAPAVDQVLVLDIGAGRVSYLTLDGDFVTSQQVPGNANDVALHSELGLLVAGDAFPDYYLARVTAQGNEAFGRIPDELRTDPEGVFQLPVDLVTVTGNGLIHVLDGDQLALASFDPDGELVSVVFLPREMRARRLRLNREAVESFGGPERVLGTEIVTNLRPLPDGRIFARITSEHTIGLVLDLAGLEAIPLVFPADREDWLWMQASTVYFDGMDRLVLDEGLKAAGLLTAQVEFVRRSP